MTSRQEQLEKRVAALLAVQDIAQELTSELNPERLLNKILNAAVTVLDASDGSLLLWAPSDELVFAVTENPSLLGRRIPADKGIAGWVFTTCEPLIIADVAQDKRFYQEVLSDFHTYSLIAVPLMTPTEKMGVIEVVNKKSGEQFDDQDRDLLMALAAQAAIAFANARLYQDLEADRNRIIALEDQMHEKLARDLHDGPAQTLASMMMDIEFIQKLHEREPERVLEELNLLREAAGKALNQVRNAMFERRPIILETQGLKAALEYYVERLGLTEGLNIQLDIRNLDGRLTPRIEGACFAIIREAVGNIKKHAQAKSTLITVERRATDLLVAVRDDGKGFDRAKVEEGYDRRGSLGLLNMKERSEMLGARYEIESVPGRGTLVYLIVPLPASDVSPKSPSAPAACKPEVRPNGRTRRKRHTAPLVWPENQASAEQKRGERRKGTGPLEVLNGKPAEGDPEGR